MFLPSSNINPCHSLFFDRDHLRFNMAINFGPGSFAVQFGDHLWFWDHLRTRTSPESPSQPRTTPAKTQTELGRSDVIRKALSNKGFSKQAIDIICSSWTAGTEKQYKGVWDKWSGWCHKQQIDLLQASVIQVVEVLTDCYQGGKGYSTLTLTVLHYLQRFVP